MSTVASNMTHKKNRSPEKDEEKTICRDRFDHSQFRPASLSQISKGVTYKSVRSVVPQTARTRCTVGDCQKLLIFTRNYLIVAAITFSHITPLLSVIDVAAGTSDFRLWTVDLPIWGRFRSGRISDFQ
jgi:hypothetical protein